jgi:hypothetical protein
MKNTEENLPSKADISALVKSLLPARGYWICRHDEPIDDTVYATEAEAETALEENTEAQDFAPVFDILTVGWTPETGSWSYQTGDNSYSGGAYGHPIWGVAYLTADSDPDSVANEILDELGEQNV